MTNIYEWLYMKYYAPCAKDVTASYTYYADLAQEAQQLLLSGGGTELTRTDALRNLQDIWGTTTFAAGIFFGLRLMTDLDFLEDSTPLSEAR